MRIEEHVNLLSQVWKKKYNAKVIKVGLSLGLVCPNRKNGGCIFCLADTFINQDNIENKLSLEQQILIAKEKMSKSTKVTKYVAYFQDETSTDCSIQFLQDSLNYICSLNMFEEIIISTRPDYVNKNILELLNSMPIPVTLELGVQTIHDDSLKFLNRNHTNKDTIDSLELCEKYRIPVGVHLIVGIPNESKEQIIETIDFINSYKCIKDVKFHNLVVYQGTTLANMINNIKLFDYNEYLSILSHIIGDLNSDKSVSRLFTSNIMKNGISLNPFPKYKTEWLKDLWIILKENNIKQGCFINENN